MDAKVVKVGTSLGLLIPRFIAIEGGFSQGTPITIEYSNDRIVVSRKRKVREGWAAAFKKYAQEGEDEMMLPDYIDSEVDNFDEV